MTVRMKALKPMSYAQKHYNAGQQFDVRDEHVRLLSAIGHAAEVKVKDDVKKGPEASPKIETRVMDTKAGQPKAGQYSRRDLTAEEPRK